jgi:lipoprotein-anchoring transpeptidase ErfK/SrfK
VLGDKEPTLSDGVDGHWKRTDDHTLRFVPTGMGFGFDQDISVKLPVTVDAVAAGQKAGTQTDTLRWHVPGASTLRLNQLLAQTGYLPLTWTASGADAAKTTSAQSHAAIDPPDGTFAWTYDDTPAELTKQWVPDQVTELTRGAVMMFQDEHDLTVDALAGPAVWKALIADVVAGKQHEGGYSYVYVHRKLPQKLTLWHDGKVILTSPGNTGVPAAPTELGTFPVFEHLKETTMSGTNPDGSHYNDPGVKWVSYFNGGDALHEFPRASFGTPQSLGCVELPEAAAKKVWPYTPIGTLVTIEN